MDLAEFLLARIAEDDEAARAGAGEPRYPHYGDTAAEEAIEMAHHEGCAKEGPAHFERWLPARVLAECDAKRRIVELHEMVTADYAGEWWTDPAPPGTYVRTGCANCTSCGVDGEDYIDDGPCPTLRLLALPYADHPDYVPDWSPLQAHA